MAQGGGVPVLEDRGFRSRCLALSLTVLREKVCVKTVGDPPVGTKPVYFAATGTYEYNYIEGCDGPDYMAHQVLATPYS